jgi:hypothetical protein
MRWIALPPHLAIDVSLGVPGMLDTEDLGLALGGPEHVSQVRRPVGHALGRPRTSAAIDGSARRQIRRSGSHRVVLR